MRLFIPIIAALALLAGPAHAEWAPKGPIKFWIGFGAGGGTDTQARALAEELEALKGWRIIPENKAGGGGAVGLGGARRLGRPGRRVRCSARPSSRVGRPSP